MTRKEVSTLSYIPHAALSAVKILNGSISGARVIVNENSKTVKYQIHCNVLIYGVPGNRTLQHVRYLGQLTYNAGGETYTSPPGYYDELIAWALQRNEPLSKITSTLIAKINGAAVTAQNLGGRWLIR